MTPDRIAELRATCKWPMSRPTLEEALDAVERLRAQLANRDADLDALRAELLEAKRERNAALDEVRSLREWHPEAG